MANLTSTTITGNANVTAEVNAATFAGDAGKTSNLAAGNIASGTLSTDRLPTVPTTKGGTGLTSLGSAGQVLTVSAPGSALEFADASGGGGYNLQVFTNPGTYTPTAGMKNVKVTVVGGGGGTPGAQDGQAGSQSSNGGGGGGAAIEELTAAQVGASQPVTVGAGGNAGNHGQNSFNPGNPGGTSSFGNFLSATGGQVGSSNNGQASGGSGSGGNINVVGGTSYVNVPGSFKVEGADSALGFGIGGFPSSGPSGPDIVPGQNGTGFGAGGGGTGNLSQANPFSGSSGAGSAGIVIVEEFL